MNNQIVSQTVTFNNQELITFEQNGVQYTAMKPICENIGIDWESQRQRIKRDDILSKVACMIKATGLDGKIYEMLSLPIQFLNGWLFGVDSKRVKTDEAKKNLMAYKLECYQVLHDYWHKGEAVNPRFEKITNTQAYKLKTAVEKRCKNNKEHYQTVWTALKHRFEVPKYTDILVKDFDNAMNLVWTIALPPVVEKPQPQTPTDKELYEILHAAISSHHQLHRMTKSLAVTLHVRDTIDYQLRGLREQIIKVVKFADNQNLQNRFGQPLVSHQAKLNAWDGASWSIAVTA